MSRGIPKGRKLKERITIFCELCHKELQVTPCHVYGRKRRFCSRECALKARFAQSKNRTYAWQQRAREVRKRAHYRCELCGQSQRSHRELIVHHKIPRNAFKSLRQADAFNNLIAVCSTCHGKLEGQIKKKDIPRYSRMF